MPIPIFGKTMAVVGFEVFTAVTMKKRREREGGGRESHAGWGGNRIYHRF
jgi:hypothetical protein